MEKSEIKNIDSENIEKGFNLIIKFMQEHAEIESTLWADVIWSVLVEGYNLNGVSYNEFNKELDMVKVFYKPWFDKVE